MKFDIATSWIQYFPSMCFQSLYRAVNQCHLSQICVSLNYMVATNTIITLSIIFRWASTGQHVLIMLHSFKRYVSPVNDVSLII